MTTYQVAIADAMYAMTAKCKSKKLWFNLLKQNINQNGRQTHWHKHRGVCTAKYLRSIQNQNGYLQKTRALDFNLQQDFCCRKNAFRITLSAENFQQEFGAREVCRASQCHTLLCVTVSFYKIQKVCRSETYWPDFSFSYIRMLVLYGFNFKFNVQCCSFLA